MAIAGRVPVAVALLLAACLATGATSPREGENDLCEDIEGAAEVDGQCKCEDLDSIVSSDATRCLRVAFEGHSTACEDVAQCTARMGEGAACEGGACECVAGFHYLHGRCWNDTAHGEACEKHAECYSFSESDSYACVENACACAADAVPKRPGPHPLCRRVAREGEECESSVDCNEGLSCDKIGDDVDTICLPPSDPEFYSRSGNVSWDYLKDSKQPKEADIECTGSHEELTPSETSCICEHGYYKVNNAACYPELGEPCVIGESADHIDNVACRRSAKYEYDVSFVQDDDKEKGRNNREEEEQGVWACLGGFNAGPSNRECVKSLQIDSECQTDAQCGHFGGHCQDQQCGCPERYYYSSPRLLCWPTSGVNEECEVDEDCVLETPNSAECNFNVSSSTEPDTKDDSSVKICQCKSGYYAFNGDCRKEAYSLGESCISVEDCVFAIDDPSVICDEVCACNAGYFESPDNNTICLVGVEGPCNGTEDCEAVGNTTCAADSTCQCKKGFTSIDYSRCAENCNGVPETLEGEDGKCYCKNLDTVLDGSETKCLEVAFDGYFAPCQDSRQCVARMGVGGVCQNSQCACTEDYHYLHGLCIRDTAYGEPCKENSDCYAYAEMDAYACVEGVCACAKYATTARREPNPVCRRIGQEGEECEGSLDCAEGLKCDRIDTDDLDYVCLIDPATRKEDAEEKGVQYGRSQLQALSLRRSTIQNVWKKPKHSKSSKVQEEPKVAECLENEMLTDQENCVCKHGYYRYNSTLCVPELGEPCVLGVDSADYILYMACRRSAKYEYVPPDTDEDDDQGEKGRSDDSGEEPHGVWACLGGFVALPGNRVCEKTRQHTFNCEVDERCGYYGGVCVSGKCACETGYHYDTTYMVCWPTSGLNEACESDRDCGVATADSVQCDIEVSEDSDSTEKGICRCKPGYRATADDCKKEANALNERCTATEDCVFANGNPTVFCSGGYCSCIAGYLESPTDNTLCLVGVNGPCENNGDCSAVENSACNGANCTCSDGFVAEGTRKCLEIRTEYGEECEEHQQCEGIAPVDDVFMCYPYTSTCICLPNYHFQDAHCWLAKGLNEQCDSPQECLVDNSVCRNKYCTCDYGYVQNGDACDNAASPISAGSLIALAFVVLTTRLF